MQMLRQLTSLLYWFNPLVWKAAQRSALDAECACDDQVISSGIDAKDYAKTLLATAQGLMQSPHPFDAVPGMARPSELKVRIYSLLTARQHLPISQSWMAASVLCSAMLVLVLAALNPVIADQQEVPFRLYYAGSNANGPIDLLVDGEVRLAAIKKHRVRTSVDQDPVDFKLPPGEYTLAVRYSPESTSSTQILAEESVKIKKDRRYIAFVLGEGENTLLRIVVDDLQHPGQGQQKVRVVHGAPQRGEFSVQLRAFEEATREPGAVLYKTPTLRFGDISPYVTFDAEPKFHFDIQSASYRDASGHRGEVFVQDGTITTIVVTDRDHHSTGFVFWSPENIYMLKADPAVRQLLQQYPSLTDIDLVEKLRDDPTLLTKLQIFLTTNSDWQK